MNPLFRPMRGCHMGKVVTSHLKKKFYVLKKNLLIPCGTPWLDQTRTGDPDPDPDNWGEPCHGCRELLKSGLYKCFFFYIDFFSYYVHLGEIIFMLILASISIGVVRSWSYLQASISFIFHFFLLLYFEK